MNTKFKMSILATALIAVTSTSAIAQVKTDAVTEQKKNKPTKQSIKSVHSISKNGAVEVKIEFLDRISHVPKHMIISNPNRIVIDLPNTVNKSGQRLHEINIGDISALNIIQGEGTARLVVNMKSGLSPNISVEDNSLVLKFGLNEQLDDKKVIENIVGGAEKLSAIDFRRGPAGEGRVVVDLSNHASGVEVKKVGKNLQVDFDSTEINEVLLRRLNVTDFGTPVQSVTLSKHGKGVRMLIEPTGLWEYNSYQTDNRFVLEVRPIQYDPNKLVQGTNAGYKGEHMSLNFQNIDIRNLINVIADFTGINIIASDSVNGMMSIKLDDVPWDQALDIVMQSRGLDMRKNGNVIWVAPANEIAQREKEKLQNEVSSTTLEPLRTFTIRLNYTNATDIHAILSKKEQKLLSERGSVVVDNRTNQLIIRDTANQIEELEKVIKKLDIPVQQVMIEARIVEAGDKFSKNLGARLGFGAAKSNIGIGSTMGQTFYNTARATGAGTGEVDAPDLVSSMNTNLPGNPMSGGAALGSFAMTLLNGTGTRFLNLELNALEADGRGKIVSSPSVVTADKEIAIIEQGTEIPYSEASSSGAATTSFKKANLKLEVLPQITPDGNVIMAVDINKDAPGLVTSSGIAIDTKHVKTKVLVENGGTVVIGGIFVQEERNDVNKVPLIGDLPVVGNAFKNTTKVDNKTELLIFLTPRLLGDKIGSSQR